MSNARAIATVTMALKEVLRENALWTVSGSEVVTLRPQEAEKLPNDSPRINLYLYQIVPNVAFRTADLPTRRSDGSVIQKPQSAWDLHYLLSFFGNETTGDDQLLLGSTVDVFHAQPFLSREKIRDTIRNNPYLVGSNLAEQVESVKFTPLVLNLEELSKVWSVFFQTPYSLSIAYQASVVLIEADEIPRPALPVLQRNIYPVTFRQPMIERVLSQVAENQPILPNQPILTGHRLILEGRQLQGDTTRIRVGQVELAQNLTVSDTRISFVLPPTVKAGVRGVQVAHVMKISTPERDYRYVESNVAAFVLRPTITDAIDLSNVQENGRVITIATIPVSPAIAPNQRVVLLLNQRPGATTTNLAAYQFTAPPVTTESPSLAIPIDLIPAGEYLVRLQVNGAESLLAIDTDSESPTFNQYNGPILIQPHQILGNITVSQVQANGIPQTVISIPVHSPITPQQQVWVLLSELTTSSATNFAEAYRFELPARAAELSTLQIPIQNVRAGRYLVKLQVDGVESLLTEDANHQLIAPILIQPHQIIGDIAVTDVPENGATRTVLNISLDSPIGTQKRVLVLLGELLNSSATTFAEAYRFELPARANELSTLQIPIQGVQTGRYLVKLQVDGVESLLTEDANHQLIGPTVTIP